MSASEQAPGAELPKVVTRPPGQHSRTFWVRHTHAAAPMGPARAQAGIVYATATGANVIDVDGNRYVDLAGGFGAALVGHRHPSVLRALDLQKERLLHALGDMYPSDAKIGLVERLAKLHPEAGAQVIVGQSGSDAVSAALKTACLVTGRPGVLAFGAAYHGLGYGPLPAQALRQGYKQPFLAQLNPHVAHAPYPEDEADLSPALERAERLLAEGGVGAVLVEPILGRGGVIVPPTGFLSELAVLARRHGALFVADEIWTGLGRAGAWLRTRAAGVVPDLICLGKGLGGGLPISAVIGTKALMAAWRREPEVVHTSTYAGAPLACAAALATLDVLGREALPERAARVGNAFRDELGAALAALPEARVRGEGLMIGVDCGARPGAAVLAVKSLLERGFLATTGGGKREVLVLTPPLTIAEPLLKAALPAIVTAVGEALAASQGAAP
jgi:4-aminobutyrate aminotransferase / (S)-3-amino-2-methylpropionate transaminase / 5-aminovalerate transaminase